MGLAIHNDEPSLPVRNGGLARKILTVMGRVGPVHKDKRNDFHGYGYASDEAVVTAIRTALIETGLCITPSQKSCTEIIQRTAKGEEVTLTKLEVEFLLTDSETGETVASTFFGYGSDKIDKGVYKAMTGAEKYFLMKTFLIATPDDPENEGARRAFAGNNNRQPSAPPTRRPYVPSSPPPAPAKPAAPPPPPTTDLAGEPLAKGDAQEPVWDQVATESAQKTADAMNGERPITEAEYSELAAAAKDRRITVSQMVIHARNNLGAMNLKALTKRQFDRMIAWVNGRTK